jgi:DNA-binding transcriptional MerR regulator
MACTWSRLQVHGAIVFMKGSPTAARLKIGDVARLAQLSVDAVRFYEREGLLGRVRRTAAGQRQYDGEAVRRLGFVRRATALGFSLSEVRGLLNLRVSARLPCEHVRERALDKLADIERRIAELEAMRGALARLAAGCSEGTTNGTCPFLDELYRPIET